MDYENLPRLTAKENAFVMHYFSDALNDRAKAYKLSYDCKNSSEKTIYEEASKLLKNPKITPWIAYYEESLQEYQEQEIKYTRRDFFDDLDRIRAKTEDSPKTISVALKAIETKGKAFGYLKENINLSGSTTLNMGTVELDNGQEVTFDVGSATNESTRDT